MTTVIVAAVAGIGSVTTYAIAQRDGDEPPALPAVEWPSPMGGKAPLKI